MNANAQPTHPLRVTGPTKRTQPPTFALRPCTLVSNQSSVSARTRSVECESRWISVETPVLPRI